MPRSAVKRLGICPTVGWCSCRAGCRASRRRARHAGAARLRARRAGVSGARRAWPSRAAVPVLHGRLRRLQLAARRLRAAAAAQTSASWSTSCAASDGCTDRRRRPTWSGRPSACSSRGTTATRPASRVGRHFGELCFTYRAHAPTVAHRPLLDRPPDASTPRSRRCRAS